LSTLATFAATLPADDFADPAEWLSAFRHEASRRIRREAAVVVEIRCPTCTRVLPDDAFALNRSRPSGRSWQCRECSARALRSRRAAKRTAVASPPPLTPQENP
jgi:hypothetical protein